MVMVVTTPVLDCPEHVAEREYPPDAAIAIGRVGRL
jgi:hypothetical protein